MPVTIKGKSGLARRTGRKVRAVLPKSEQKAVAKIARSVVNRKLETQQVGTNEEYAYTAIYGSTLPTGGTPQLFPCMPQLSQGITDETRKGNKVSPTRLTTDLRFVFNEDAIISTPTGNVPASQAGWDITVHVWYGFVKRFKRVDWLVQNEITILGEHLQDVTGTSVPWTGTLADETLDINKDVLTMKHKTLRMYKNAGLANALDVVSPSLSTPMSEAKRMRLNWKVPKTFVYNEDGALIPENYAPFIIVGYCHNDATPASSISNAGPTNDISRIPAVKMLKVDKLFYKDA